MDQWTGPNLTPDLDEKITRARMRRPARLAITTSPDTQEYLGQLRVAGLPDPAPILLAATRRRIIAEMAAELRADRLQRLVDSVHGPRTRASVRMPRGASTRAVRAARAAQLGPKVRTRLDQLRALVASACDFPMDLTKPVRRDSVRAAFAVSQLRRYGP